MEIDGSQIQKHIFNFCEKILIIKKTKFYATTVFSFFENPKILKNLPKVFMSQ